MNDVDDLVAAARARLGGVAREARGEYVPAKRMLGIGRAPRIVRRGSAWHVGALLISDDAVFAIGEIVRAHEETRRGYTAESQRARAELTAAARRGGFAEGEVVHIGWRPADAAGVLVLREGRPHIRWSAGGVLMPLDHYLDERIELLIHPPAGAT